MLADHLRQLSQQQIRWKGQIKAWQEQGAQIIEGCPPGEALLLAFRTDSGWKGAIDLYEWISKVMPDAAQLAPQFFRADQLETLFIHSARPFDSGLPELGYQTLISNGRLDHACFAGKSWPALATAQGTVWLLESAETMPSERVAGARDLHDLPVSLHFELGYSTLSLATMKKIACGDLLVIRHQASIVTVKGKKMGFYHQREGQYMLEEYREDEFYTEDERDFPEEMSEEDEWQDTSLSARDKIPVRLTFTLEERNVTVAELEQLWQGACLTCLPQAEKNITVRANGVALAKGELVWVEDRMGVEITSICHEAGNGK
ncbi:type III secretion system cytoplasmic ring protein SctQ [[Erwinia] mediterraneensis]|uniref:type III secretion system cytoplasmic ring protein SctQ n=1 Tax=[Erwinia] mediterraneensis TaxID=2161819 RepID=UPI001031DD75|nr:type III secretion system cytoplasmic ring protein SctQ [[Erwinia] mediterraneensis]